MEKFEFYEKYKELADMKNVTALDKRLDKIMEDDEVCLGHRTIGDRNYHIFFLRKDGNFAVYYHGGGVDSMYRSESLGDVLNYVNTL